MSTPLPDRLAFYIPSATDRRISFISSKGLSEVIEEWECRTWRGFCVRTGESIEIEIPQLECVLYSYVCRSENPLRDQAIDDVQAVLRVNHKWRAAPGVRYPTLAASRRPQGAVCAYSAIVRIDLRNLIDFPDLQADVADSAFLDSIDVMGDFRDEFPELPPSQMEQATRAAIAELQLTPGWRLPCSVENNGTATLGCLLLDEHLRDAAWQVRLFVESPTTVNSGTVLARRFDHACSTKVPTVRYEAILGTVLEATPLD